MINVHPFTNLSDNPSDFDILNLVCLFDLGLCTLVPSGKFIPPDSYASFCCALQVVADKFWKVQCSKDPPSGCVSRSVDRVFGKMSFCCVHSIYVLCVLHEGS